MTDDRPGLVDVLGAHAELAWYRTTSRGGEAGSTQPPLVVWRFAPSVSQERVEELVAALRLVLREHPTPTQWHLTSRKRKQLPGHNWVLEPAFLAELMATGQYRVDVQAMIHLQGHAPDACRQANLDLLEIARRLSDHLARGT